MQETELTLRGARHPHASLDKGSQEDAPIITVHNNLQIPTSEAQGRDHRNDAQKDARTEKRPWQEGDGPGRAREAVLQCFRRTRHGAQNHWEDNKETTFELPVNIVTGRRSSSGATAERDTARDCKREENTCRCAPRRQRAQLHLEGDKEKTHAHPEEKHH